MTFASSLSTCKHIPSGSMDLGLVCLTIVKHDPLLSRISPPCFRLLSGTCNFWRLVKTEVKKALSSLTLAYPVSPGPLPHSAAALHFPWFFFCSSCTYSSPFCGLLHPLPDVAPGGFLALLTLASACWDSASIFLTDSLSLLPPSVYFLSVFQFCQELPVHPFKPPGIFAWLPACWDGLFLLELGWHDSWNRQVSQISCISRALSHGTISSRSLKRSKQVCSPEVQGGDPAFCSAPSSQDPELYHLKVTAGKDAFDLHIPDLPLLACKLWGPSSEWVLISRTKIGGKCSLLTSPPSIFLVDLCPLST